MAALLVAAARGSLARAGASAARVGGASLPSACRGFATGGVVEVGDDDAWDKVVAGPGLVVTDFTAAWCGPCKAAAPKYAELAERNPAVTFLKVDVDNEEMVRTVVGANVTAVPTFTFHKGGKKLIEVRGADIARVEALVEEHK